MPLLLLHPSYKIPWDSVTVSIESEKKKKKLYKTQENTPLEKNPSLDALRQINWITHLQNLLCLTKYSICSFTL